MSDFTDVGDFHRKFGLDHTTDFIGEPENAENFHDKGLMDFRMVLIREEVKELQEALDAGDLVEVADALIDLEYVTLGFHHTLGLPHRQLWEDVQRANMSKRRALPDGSDSKRSSGHDVVKPEGWQPPNGREILKRSGFDV